MEEINRTDLRIDTKSVRELEAAAAELAKLIPGIQNLPPNRFNEIKYYFGIRMSRGAKEAKIILAALEAFEV